MLRSRKKAFYLFAVIAKERGSLAQLRLYRGCLFVNIIHQVCFYVERWQKGHFAWLESERE